MCDLQKGPKTNAQELEPSGYASGMIILNGKRKLVTAQLMC